MASTPEGKVKKAVIAFLGTLPHCWWFLPVSNGMGQMGIPDIIVCYRGLFIGIETKAPGKLGNTTPLQAMQLRRIGEALGRWIVADDVALVRELFWQIDRELRIRAEFHV